MYFYKARDLLRDIKLNGTICFSGGRKNLRYLKSDLTLSNCIDFWTVKINKYSRVKVTETAAYRQLYEEAAARNKYTKPADGNEVRVANQKWIY